ncbi:hypothetical protein [Hymenobacter sp. B81]|uniref:hypothetical protein n=1 Tax=Hymenobacter sp. B81 TaxID=3344878 RepID=UPI0037DCD724
MDPFFLEEARRLEQVAGLAEAEMDQLRRMLAEGVYELTLRTRTQALTLPVGRELANGLLSDLAEDAETRRDQLLKEAAAARNDAAHSLPIVP